MKKSPYNILLQIKCNEIILNLLFKFRIHTPYMFGNIHIELLYRTTRLHIFLLHECNNEMLVNSMQMDHTPCRSPLTPDACQWTCNKHKIFEICAAH